VFSSWIVAMEYDPSYTLQFLDSDTDCVTGFNVNFNEAGYSHDKLVPHINNKVNYWKKVAKRAIVPSLCAGIAATVLSYYKKLPQKISNTNSRIPKIILKPLAWLSPLAIGAGTAIVSFIPFYLGAMKIGKGIRRERETLMTEYSVLLQQGKNIFSDGKRATTFAGALEYSLSTNRLSEDKNRALLGLHCSELGRHFRIGYIADMLRKIFPASSQ